MEVNMLQEMHCICGFAASNGNKMAQHLANCGLSTCYPSLEVANENAVKRNMLDMLGLVRRDGETSGDGGEMGDTADGSIEANEQPQGTEDDEQQQQQQDVQQMQQQHQQLPDESQQIQENIQEGVQHHQAYLENQPRSEPDPQMPEPQMREQQAAPIQFGEMEAAPVMMDSQQVQADANFAQVSVVQHQQQQQQQQHQHQQQQHHQHQQQHQQLQQQHQQQQQYGMTGYGQGALSTDIDMPLIGELTEPNAPPTPQFLGEVHTPMFDAVAAAEQQHYHAQQHHHHHPQ